MRRLVVFAFLTLIVATGNAQNKGIVLEPLPYIGNALEPVITQETFDYHWGKHLKAYVDKTNELIAGTPYETMTLVDIIKNSDGVLFNNAAQVFNHNFFFESLSPTPKAKPDRKSVV